MRAVLSSLVCLTVFTILSASTAEAGIFCRRNRCCTPCSTPGTRIVCGPDGVCRSETTPSLAVLQLQAEVNDLRARVQQLEQRP